MGNENFLRIPDLDDRVNDPKYKKWILLHSLVLGRASGGSGTGGGMGGGSGRITFNAVSFLKSVDNTSALLLEFNTNGKPLAEAAVFMPSLGAGSALAILLMKKVYVDSVQWSGSHGDTDPVENVSLSFGEAQYMPVVQYLARRGAAAVAGLLH